MANFPFTVLITRAFFCNRGLLNVDGVGFLGGLLLVVSGFKGMCFQPGFAVVGSKGLCLIVLQVNEVIIVSDTAFGDMSAKLAAKHNIREVQSFNDATITLDTELVVTLITLIAHRFQNGLELFDGGEMVLQSLLDHYVWQQ